MPSHPFDSRPSFRLRSALLLPIALGIGLVLAAPRESAAQTFLVGVQGGAATDASDGFDGSGLDARFFEVRGAVELEPGVLFRLRAGRMDLSSPDRALSPDSTVERLGFDVEYQMNMGYYRAGLFLGGGWYRFDSDEADRLPGWDDGDDHFGYWIGVNGWFDLTHDFSIVPEFSVERVDQKEKRTFGRLAIGVEYRF